MGIRRKSRAKPAPKKIEKLDTAFNCPFCNHPGSVDCYIDMRDKVGEAICGICKESFSTTVTALTEPIDMKVNLLCIPKEIFFAIYIACSSTHLQNSPPRYCEWIDECERVNNLGGDDEQ